jgi:carboxyl-terminal processing protease
LLRRGLFDQFVTAYLDGKGLKVRSAYSKDLRLFKESFSITDEILGDFRSYVVQRDVKINEKEYGEDLSFIKTRLKASFARSFWGNDGWYPVMLQVDVPFQKALSLFPEAEKIARLN